MRAKEFIFESRERQVTQLFEDLGREINLHQRDLTPRQVFEIFEAAIPVPAGQQPQQQVQQQPQQVQQPQKQAQPTGALDKLKAMAVNAKMQLQQIMNNPGGPVEGFDQKFDKLKQQITAKMGKTSFGPSILKSIDKLREIAESNEYAEIAILTLVQLAASLALTAGTVAAGSVAGPSILAGAAVAGIVSFGMKLLLGSKLSAAAKSGVKSAAIGAVIGGAIQGIEHLADTEIENVFVKNTVDELLHGSQEAAAKAVPTAINAAADAAGKTIVGSILRHDQT